MIAGEYGILLGFHPALACTLQRFLWVEAQLHRSQQRGGVWATSTLWPEPLWSSWEDLSNRKELCFRALAEVLALPCLALPCRDLNSTRLLITIHSELPATWGIGSSAAVSLGCVLASSEVLKLKLSDDALQACAIRAQRSYQQGLASGYDVLTAFHGGAVWCEPCPSLTETAAEATSSVEHLDDLRKNISLFGQSQKVSTTGNLLCETLLSLLHPDLTEELQAYPSPHASNFSALQALMGLYPRLHITQLSAVGQRVIHSQKNLLHHLRQRSTLPDLIAATHQACEALKATCAFSTTLHQLHHHLTATAGYGIRFAWKPSGAGGDDLLLVVGEVSCSLRKTLKEWGYLPATTFSSRRAERTAAQPLRSSSSPPLLSSIKL